MQNNVQIQGVESHIAHTSANNLIMTWDTVVVCGLGVNRILGSKDLPVEDWQLVQDSSLGGGTMAASRFAAQWDLSFEGRGVVIEEKLESILTGCKGISGHRILNVDDARVSDGRLLKTTILAAVKTIADRPVYCYGGV